MQSTGYHKQLMDLSTELVNHGWGKMTFIATAQKDDRVRVEITCGKGYVTYIKKEIKFGDNFL